MIPWEPNRDAALSRLEAFLPQSGGDYARRRNFDFGRPHTNVSCLSPWLRMRVLTEEEVIVRVLEQYDHREAEKFISEVYWRTYWKGWLEIHPDVWKTYCANTKRLVDDNFDDENVQTAIKGDTGVECFDHWCRELIETGYMHNHARMWFASIWVFTLRLPWQLGADFFLRHLLDGDPASNTLSWRWVAGLQTKGKAYAARPDNILKFTDGRFHPEGKLAETTSVTPFEAVSFDARSLTLPAHCLQSVTRESAGLLVHDDDLFFEASGFKTIAAIHSRGALSPLFTSKLVLDFTKSAIQQRVDTHEHARVFACDSKTQYEDVIGDVVTWAQKYDLRVVVAPYAPCGPNAELLLKLAGALKRASISLQVFVRDWDRNTWPHAGKGFFALKKKIPSLLQKIRTEDLFDGP